MEDISLDRRKNHIMGIENISEIELMGTIFSASLTLLALLPAIISILITHYLRLKDKGIKDEYLKLDRMLIWSMCSILACTAVLSLFALSFLLDCTDNFIASLILLTFIIIAIPTFVTLTFWRIRKVA